MVSSKVVFPVVIPAVESPSPETKVKVPLERSERRMA